MCGEGGKGEIEKNDHEDEDVDGKDRKEKLLKLIRTHVAPTRTFKVAQRGP